MQAESRAAAAQVVQTRASNLNIVYGAPIVSVRQRNDVSADAAVEAIAHLTAEIEQQQAGAPTGDQWAEADQWVGSAQVAGVGALGTQSGARNVNIEVVRWGSFSKSLAIMKDREKVSGRVRAMVQRIEKES